MSIKKNMQAGYQPSNNNTLTMSSNHISEREATDSKIAEYKKSKLIYNMENKKNIGQIYAGMFSDSEDEDEDEYARMIPSMAAIPKESHFLDEYRTDVKSIKNVFSPAYGGFNISHETAVDLLFDKLSQDYKSGKTQTYAEKQLEHSGILLDFDCYQKSEIPQITDGMITELVEVIGKSAIEMFNMPNDEAFHIVLIKRPLVRSASNMKDLILPYVEKKKSYKTGFHILIPEIHITKTMKQLFNLYLDEKINKVLSACKFTNADDDDVLDKASSYVPVFFVGSIKPNKDKRPAYPLSGVWRVDVWDKADSYDVESVSLRRMAKYNIPLEFAINKYGTEKFCNKQERKFSEFGNSRHATHVKALADLEVKAEKYKPQEKEIKQVQSNRDSFISILGRILDTLDASRSSNTRPWYSVMGVCIQLTKTYDLDEAVIIDLFDTFSKRDPNRYIGSADEIRDKFMSISGKGYMGLLWHWLKIDNLSAYKDIIKAYFTAFPPPVSWKSLSFEGREITTFEERQEFITKLIEFMNKKYCLIKANKTFILEEFVDIDEDDEFCVGIKYKDIKSFGVDFRNKTIHTKLSDDEIKKHKQQLGLSPNLILPSNEWMSHYDRREVDKIVFDPKMYFDNPDHAENYYNLFTGFKITQEDVADVEIPDDFEEHAFFKHLLDRWCNGNREAYNVVLNVFSHILQKPWIKLQISIILKSTMRTGKGIPLQIFSEIIGGKYLFQPSQPSQVLGTFNGQMKDTLLLFMDEMVWGGDKERAGTIKKLATEKVNYINEKFAPVIRVKNLANMFMASNEDWVVPAGATEQRWMVLNVSDELAVCPKKKKNKIVKDILSIDRKQLARFFYERDLTGWSDRQTVNTAGLREQKVNSLCGVNKWWNNILCNGYIPENEDGMCSSDSGNFGKMVRTNLIFNIAKPELGRHTNEKKFWLEMKKILSDKWKKTRKMINGKREYMVNIPPLDVCRARWCELYNDEDWFEHDDIIDVEEDDIDDSDDNEAEC
jgi:hypothetical protein